MRALLPTQARRSNLPADDREARDDRDERDDVDAPAEPPAPPDPEHVARVGSQDVREAVAAGARSAKVREDELEDVCGDAFVRLLQSSSRPADLDGYAGLGFKIGHDAGVDHLRKRDRRGETNAGPTDQADEIPADEDDEPRAVNAVEAGEQAALWREFVDGKQLDEVDQRMLVMRAEGFTDAEIAHATGIPVTTARRRLDQASERLALAWKRKLRIMIGGGVLGCILLWALFAWHKRDVEAHLHDHDIRPDDSVIIGPPAPDPLEQAERIRVDALEDCVVGSYAECERALDVAKRLDPASETRPDVANARQHILESKLPPPVGPAKPQPPR